MKRTHKQFVSLTALIIPMAVTIGCASTDQSLAKVDDEYTTETSLTETTPIVESYQTDSFETETELQDETTIDTSFDTLAYESSEVETTYEEMLNTGSMIDEPEVAVIEEIIEIDTIEVDIQDSSTTLSQEENMEVDGLVELAIKEISADEHLIGQPEQNVIQFGFDKYELTAVDIEALKQHATYLKQYPHLTLVITGHTDVFGPKSYNQQLSELRANSVAGILMTEGVAEQQLNVNGLGDAIPVTDPKHYKENRRVELTYQDSMFVSNK